MWTVTDIGWGNGSASVSQGRILVNGHLQDDPNEILTALDAQGKILWWVSIGKGWPTGFPVSNSTPTIVGERAYTSTLMGQVSCVDLASQSVTWTVDVNEIFKGMPGPWGVVESPLVVDGQVIASPCGKVTTLVALDAATGQTRWQTESLGDKAAYVSPVLTEWAGYKMIITVTARTVLAVDSSNGRILWTYPYGEMDHMDHAMTYMINAVMPIVHEDRIFVTSGYDHWGVMLKMQEDGQGVELVWKDRTLDNHHGGVVLVNGCLYGSNWIGNRNGHWVCQDWNTGEVYYESEALHKGSIITADGLLYCLSEKKGNMALVKPERAGFEILSQFQLPQAKGPFWSHPTIADGILLIRHGDQLHAYDIKSAP